MAVDIDGHQRIAMQVKNVHGFHKKQFLLQSGNVNFSGFYNAPKPRKSQGFSPLRRGLRAKNAVIPGKGMTA